MKKNKIQKIRSFPAEQACTENILEYIGECFQHKKIDKHLAAEYHHLLEEVLLKLIRNADPDAEITIEVSGTQRSMSAKLKCPGNPVNLGMEDSADLGGRFIEEYQDYLQQSYLSGVNEVVFSASSDSVEMLKQILIVFAVVIVGALVLKLACTPDQITYLTDNVIQPINNLFVGFLQALAAPMVFFCVAAIVIKLRLTFQNDRRLVTLFIKYAATSAIAIVIGFLVVLAWNALFSFDDFSKFTVASQNVLGNTLKEFIEQFTFTNIMEPFQNTNPLPMLILAVVLGAAASTLFERHGAVVRKGVLSLQSLFSRMLAIIYKFIPIFMGLALLLNLMKDVKWTILNFLELFALFFACAFFMFIVYGIQLAISGVNPFRFLREYKDVLIENLKIGSNINALPYNKRVLTKRTGAPDKFIKSGLELGAMISMDGCCLIISAYTFYLIYAMKIQVPAGEFISAILIVIMIAFGAPNQPGTFLMAMIFVIKSLGVSSAALIEIVYAECLLGVLYSTINSWGDIVTMVSEASIMKKKKDRTLTK